MTIVNCKNFTLFVHLYKGLWYLETRDKNGFLTSCIFMVVFSRQMPEKELNLINPEFFNRYLY